MTVSNVISSVMVYLDRFLIGAVLTIGAVAYYTVPFDVVTRLSVVPSAIAAVLFPAFAATYARDAARAGRLFDRGVKYVSLALFPAVALIVLLAPEGLTWWLDPAFAANSAPVLRWLAVGVFANSLGQIPFGFVQSVGRPDLTARLHAIELPLYLLTLMGLLHAWGITGAAVAWTARVTADAVCLFVMAAHRLPRRAPAPGRLLLAAAGGAAVVAMAAVPQPLWLKSVDALAGLALAAVVGWRWLLAPDERADLVALLRRRHDPGTRTLPDVS
jgi:O-antigen/teichoic acid export membrane protein